MCDICVLNAHGLLGSTVNNLSICMASTGNLGFMLQPELLHKDQDHLTVRNRGINS